MQANVARRAAQRSRVLVLRGVREIVAPEGVAGAEGRVAGMIPKRVSCGRGSVVGAAWGRQLMWAAMAGDGRDALVRWSRDETGVNEGRVDLCTRVGLKVACVGDGGGAWLIGHGR